MTAETIRYSLAELTMRDGTSRRISGHPNEGPFWYTRHAGDPDVVGVKLIRHGRVELIGRRP